jgi:uncharacterized membrane protein
MVSLLFGLIIAAIVLGLIIWLIQMIPGMDPQFVTIIRVVAIVIFVVYVIYALYGLVEGGHAPALK